MRQLLAVGAIFTLVSGFTSGADLEYQQWQRFIGMTMSQWMDDTGLWPDSMYDEGPQARVFVLQHGRCDVQLHAKLTGQAGPGAWTIVKTVHRGFCGDI